MASIPSNGAGPSRTASTTSSSTSMNTIQRSAGPSSDDDTFPVVSSSLSSPISPAISETWHLDEPTESLAGISFSPTFSATYTPPKKIATSPYTRQKAFRRGSRQRSVSPTSSQSQSASISLLENTLKLDSLGVSSKVPDPLIAPIVTLSSRCRPDVKVIFDQTHFTIDDTHTEAKRRSQQSQFNGVADLAGIGGEDADSLQIFTTSLPSQNSGLASTRSSITLTSPASTSSILPTNTTVATSLTLDADSQSVTSTTSSIPAITKKPAWSTPRSWAEMASTKGGNGTGVGSSLGTPFSENLNGAIHSPSQSSHANFAPRSSSNGKDQKANSGPRGLEEIMQDAETRFTAPLTYPRGMINKGNLCFANAILQVLIYCAPFYNLFRLVGEQVAHDFHNSTPLMEAVVYFLSEFKKVSTTFQNSLLETPSLAMDLLRDIQASSEPFAPEYVYDAMKLNRRFDAMRRGHQEDAEEFLGFFLDTLHEELLIAVCNSNEKLNLKAKVRGTKSITTNESANGGRLDTSQDVEGETQREVQRPVSPTEGDGWLEVGQKGRTSFTRTTSTAHSPITRIFGGKLRSLLRMPGSKDSVTLEPYQPLQLDIQPSHVTTVEEALQNLTVPEIITGVYSPSFKRPVDATKQVFIETLPPVLILHLKRFVYDDIGGVQKSLKVLGYGPTLEISESTISPARRGETKRRYKLFGVIYHHGRFASGGHYTVDVLKQDQSEWIHIDDTTWSPVSIPSVQAEVEVGGGSSSSTKQHHDGLAYLLFYAREDAVLTNRGKGTEGENISAATSIKIKQASASIQSSKHQRVSSTASNKIQSSKR